VKPAPVSVDDNLAILSRTATLGGTVLPCHPRMGFRLLRAHQLPTGYREKRGGQDKVPIHDEKLAVCVMGVESGPDT
jgi:hypothetical protein